MSVTENEFLTFLNSASRTLVVCWRGSVWDKFDVESSFVFAVFLTIAWLSFASIFISLLQIFLFSFLALSLEIRKSLRLMQR